MAIWEFSAMDLLFPIAVVALWGAIFLLMLFIIRFAAHEHDGEAQAEARAEAQREERGRAQATGPTMTPLPS